MSLNIFTKLFLIYIFFTLLPIIITGGLIFFGYDKIISGFFPGEKKEISIEIGQIILILIIIFLCLFLGFLLARKIISPLKKIVKGAEEIKKGNLDLVIETKSKDELGELARYFNEITQELKKTRLILEETKNTIKEKVAANTRELEKLIETREKTIKQRAEELQGRVDELETIHRLSVGRELKMIELKKEIEELKSKPSTPLRTNSERSRTTKFKNKKT